MGAAGVLWETISECRRALVDRRLPACKRRQLTKAYLKLRLRRLGFDAHNVLGFKVDYACYKVFFELFREIFVNMPYFIETEPKKIIDCGANIGMATLFFKWLWPDCSIVAFEPDETSFGLLEKNVGGLNNVKLVKAAVGVGVGRRAFYCNKRKPAAGPASTVRGWYPLENVDCEQVVGVSLSNYISKKTPIDLLKIDVEGEELGVLRDLAAGGKIALVKNIVLEYHEVGKNSLAKLLGFLELHGFKCWVFNIGEPKEFITAMVLATKEGK